METSEGRKRVGALKGRELRQSVTFKRLKTSTAKHTGYQGKVKRLAEVAYGISIGIYDSETKRYGKGCSCRSEVDRVATAEHRESFTVVFEATLVAGLSLKATAGARKLEVADLNQKMTLAQVSLGSAISLPVSLSLGLVSVTELEEETPSWLLKVCAACEKRDVMEGWHVPLMMRCHLCDGFKLKCSMKGNNTSTLELKRSLASSVIQAAIHGYIARMAHAPYSPEREKKRFDQNLERSERALRVARGDLQGSQNLTGAEKHARLEELKVKKRAAKDRLKAMQERLGHA